LAKCVPGTAKPQEEHTGTKPNSGKNLTGHGVQAFAKVNLVCSQQFELGKIVLLAHVSVDVWSSKKKTRLPT